VKEKDEMEQIIGLFALVVAVWIIGRLLFPPDQPISAPIQSTSDKSNSRWGRVQAASANQDQVQVILDAALAQLPRLLDNQDLFSGTSANFRKKLSLILGPTYANSLAEITEVQLEGLRKNLEIGLRWAIRVRKAGVMRTAAPAILTAEIDTLARILAIRREAEQQYKGRPEELVLVDGFIGKMIAELLNEGSPTTLTGAAEVSRLLVSGYARRERTARQALDEIEDEMMKGTTPSQVPVDEIFKKNYGELSDDWFDEQPKDKRNGQNAR
jgi:hypothetical protein